MGGSREQLRSGYLEYDQYVVAILIGNVQRPTMQYDDETLRRLQLAQLAILKDIDSLCSRHGITYFLDSGTVLGAVRHGGFIPWDDDVDIAMLRPDYDRFLALAGEGAMGEGYTICSPDVEDRWSGMFAKVWKKGTKFYTEETIEGGIPQGIFVDIFPYDVVCSDDADARRQMSRCRTWQSISYLYHAKTLVVPHRGLLGALEKGLCSVAHQVVRRLFKPERIRASFECAARAAANQQDRSYYADMAYTKAGACPRSILVPPRPLEFEGCSFPGPADPIAYLRYMYGETWSELPPEDRRRNHAPVELDFGE